MVAEGGDDQVEEVVKEEGRGLMEEGVGEEVGQILQKKKLFPYNNGSILNVDCTAIFICVFLFCFTIFNFHRSR